MNLQDVKYINEQRLSVLHPVLFKRANDFLEVLEAGGIEVLITQGFRSWEDQARLYAQGRTAPGPEVTKAQPGYSWHQFALAFDCVPVDQVKDLQGALREQADWNVQHPAWQRMLIVGAGFHLSEGASWRTFKDYPHFYPEGLPDTPPDEVRALYHSGAIPAIWKWAEARFVTGLGLHG